MFDVNTNINANSQIYKNDTPKVEKNQNEEATKENKSNLNDSKSDTLNKGDKSETKEYKQGAAPVAISFEDKVADKKQEKTESLSDKAKECEISSVNDSKKEISKIEGKPLNTISNGQDDAKIMEFISKIKEQELDSVIKAFDEMMKHSQKLMEETQRYIKEKVIPKEEAMKVDIAKQELQKLKK